MEIPKLFKVEVFSFYFTITVGGRTWYWIKETGKFDGTSWDVVGVAE